MERPSLMERAMRIAVRAHEGQTRKESDLPYISHPTMVALILTRHGFPEEVVAAGLTHDVLEDTDVTEAVLRGELGDEVTDMVRALSEDKALPWEERKKRYIASVSGDRDGVKAISVADKLHNVSSALIAHASMGDALWDNFSRGKEAQLWFYTAFLEGVQATFKHPLVDEYAEAVARLRAL